MRSRTEDDLNPELIQTTPGSEDSNAPPPHFYCSKSPSLPPTSVGRSEQGSFHLVLVFDIWLISGLFFPHLLVTLGENPKESKPQVGTTRQQDMNRRDQQRNLGSSTTPARPNPGGVQDTEMGPCRRHLDSVLQQLQTEVFRGSHTLYVPNCDQRGFYRKRQCRSSQGQRRGPCWCVDRMGQPLPASSDSNGGSSCSTGSSG
ncbi:PREDICTED: insulin-like growth factor-binding protein 6 [Miniopterus natalensis]|uniref:insulin-like growth factor-binding protein 6 n=1 Tax=Miniopterus natalensis TaxID=291302 RepID=UPI0007A6DD38|nr:PREDICTED: insulin-like growth factor-binding protein 6 [Miniopterus natalensis]